MAGEAIVRVRCPECDEWLEVKPRIVSVARTPERLTVTLDAAPIPHVCGVRPFTVGFTGPLKQKQKGDPDEPQVAP